MFTSLSSLFVGHFRVCKLSCFRLAALNGWLSDLSTWVCVCVCVALPVVDAEMGRMQKQ